MTQPLPQLGASEVHVWLAFDRGFEDIELRAFAEVVLPAAERERHDALKVENVRRQYLLTRTLQRAMLAHYLDVEPWPLKFVTGKFGKPALGPPFDASGLQFNIAHSRGLVALAVAREVPVGIDVEPIDQKSRPAIAHRHFSEVEVRQLEALPPPQQPRRFLELWTLKEAYLKAIGAGIAGGLSSATFVFGPQVRFERAGDPDAARWGFHRFEIESEYLLALAVASGRDAARIEPRIVWHEFHRTGTRSLEGRVQPLD